MTSATLIDLKNDSSVITELSKTKHDRSYDPFTYTLDCQLRDACHVFALFFNVHFYENLIILPQWCLY